MMEKLALITFPSAKEGDPSSLPSIHLNLALTASKWLIIHMKYLMVYGVSEHD